MCRVLYIKPDIMDYVNGIGNCSREQKNVYMYAHSVLWFAFLDRPVVMTMATAVSLSTNSSEITIPDLGKPGV